MTHTIFLGLIEREQGWTAKYGPLTGMTKLDIQSKDFSKKLQELGLRFQDCYKRRELKLNLLFTTMVKRILKDLRGAK